MPWPTTKKELDAKLASFDWAAWEKKIHDAMDADRRAIADIQAEREATLHSLEWDVDDPFVDSFFTTYLAERITQLNETTRDKVRGTLAGAIERGDTDLAAQLRDAYAFAPARAEMVARTETAIAYNHGQGLAFHQNGIEQVEISDGDEDEECAAADGEIWTVEEYLEEPISHPNCTRAAAPVTPDEADTDEE